MRAVSGSGCFDILQLKVFYLLGFIFNFAENVKI